ncbi:hypothetical protein PV327_003515 [Microctonus hyperodae]|uniref:Odorant receptor n=1 Tax=Microctonus hyperodae TaxID=165561 RepID=A0AA39G4G6_MICHY|nr:hypothetical protein PV327_003515 [Microctonus hyperodae]
MTNGQMWEYREFREVITAMLYHVGLFPLKKHSKFYRLRPVLHLIFNLGFGYGMYGFIKANIKNFLLISKSILCMYIYREDMMNLMKILDEHFENLLKNVQLTNLLNGITTFRRLLWAVAIGGYITACFNSCVPIIFMIIDKINHVKREVYPLPNHSKLPWGLAGTGIIYKLDYLIQTLASLSIVTISCGVEPVFSLFVFQMVGRLRAMTYRIVHIDESSDRDSILRDCMIEYTLLLKCRDIVQKVFGPIILQMFISNAVVMSALMFQASQMDLRSWRSTVLIPYTITKFAQTYLCAFAGARLTFEVKKKILTKIL